METAYGMVAKPTSFPYAERCPTITTEGTQETTQRVKLLSNPGGATIRRLFEGEPLRIVQTQKKWARVQQLDGSEGWVKAKAAFKQ